MPVRPAALAGTVVVGGMLALGSAAPALAVCDAYSRGCLTPPEPTVVLPETVVSRTDTPVSDTPVAPATLTTSASSPSTLPFTGGELVLLSSLGAAAVGTGVALVAAGRRRHAS
jgi:hypothetical protein